MRASCEKGRTCQENPYLWVKDQKTLDISGRVARSLLAHSMRLSGELDNFPLSQTALFVIGISLRGRTSLSYIPFRHFSSIIGTTYSLAITLRYRKGRCGLSTNICRPQTTPRFGGGWRRNR